MSPDLYWPKKLDTPPRAKSTSPETMAATLSAPLL